MPTINFIKPYYPDHETLFSTDDMSSIPKEGDSIILDDKLTDCLSTGHTVNHVEYIYTRSTSGETYISTVNIYL